MATAIEYGLIAALISVAAITAFTTVAPKPGEPTVKERFQADPKFSAGSPTKFVAGGACVKFTGANEHDDLDTMTQRLVGQPVPGATDTSARIVLVRKGPILGCPDGEVAVFTIQAK